MLVSIFYGRSSVPCIRTNCFVLFRMLSYIVLDDNRVCNFVKINMGI